MLILKKKVSIILAFLMRHTSLFFFFVLRYIVVHLDSIYVLLLDKDTVVEVI